MPAYRLPIDVVNTALMHLGVERVTSLTGQSINAVEGNAAYNRLREVELRRNYWTFAIRRCILRPISTDALLWTPAAYAAGTTYAAGAIITYQNDWWMSQVGTNVGHTPEPGPYWQHYYGPDSLEVYDEDISYLAGELVKSSAGLYYLSLVNANDDDPAVTATYWRLLGGTSAALSILYPIGAGPSSQSMTRNIYRLPRGFLRKAPIDPKTGVNPYLGGPSHLWSDDWTFEGGYIISADLGPLMLRYVADVTDVAQMNAMFCEALGARIAYEIGPRLVESGKSRDKLIADAQQHYRREIFEARVVNGIEAGPVEPPEDEYISVRR